MCGIYGIAIKNNRTEPPFDIDKLRAWADSLFVLSESRGKEASGIALSDSQNITIYKQAIRGSKLIGLKGYKNLFKSLDNTKSYLSVIGHSRLATNGYVLKNSNNQPVFNNNGTLIHNGIIVNENYLWKKILRTNKKLEIDSEVILELINYYVDKNFLLKDAIKKTFSMIEGSASIALLPTYDDSLYLASNTGSIYFSLVNSFSFVFASEYYILRKFFEVQNTKKTPEINHLNQGTGLCINLTNFQVETFDLMVKVKSQRRLLKNPQRLKIFEIKENLPIEKSVKTLYSYNNTLRILKEHSFDHEKINALTRCSKCILPSTMPNISFDNNGVCNFCTSYKKIKYKGEKNLIKLLNKVKNKDGKPDCVLAFSGGRDSSYGLHFLKKMGLNPVAYTYDWGMITDLARRNQARLVGKLGIEHIIVSADISYKRNNIRKNLLAWLKKPDLGMIPLFTVGDKQAEFYVDQVAKNVGVDLVIYCSGCGMENDEFKASLSGVRNGYPAGILHNLSWPGRLKMASYYAMQFVKNPSYINSSIKDTAFGYFSTYIKRHNYLYFWYYLPWNEEQIVSTLKNEYNWEIDPVNGLTWRTDDATPAFYNYIYYRVLGFTENDTFRSNQIRENQIDRETALKLVQTENEPRFEALKWYFDVLGINGDKVLSTIDKIPAKY